MRTRKVTSNDKPYVVLLDMNRLMLRIIEWGLVGLFDWALICYATLAVQFRIRMGMSSPTVG
jgi:hypothetical protein